MPNGESNGISMDAEIEEVLDNVEEIWPEIRCAENTERWTENGPGGLADARKQIERHIRKYLRDIQASIVAKPKLLTWLEVS